MLTCYILIGVPASGKSTWIRNNPDLVPVVASSDDIIDTVASKYGFTYTEAFTSLIGFAQMAFDQCIEFSIKCQEDIAIDRTNVSPKRRKHFINKFKNAGYKVVAVYFPTPPKEEWERRLKSRSDKFIPQDVLNSMAKNLVEPSLDEGFDEIIPGEIHEEST